jgi:hypothetical protein
MLYGRRVTVQREDTNQSKAGAGSAVMGLTGDGAVGTR